MTGATGTTDLEVALALADRVSPVAMRYFEAGVAVETKDDSSPVTEADRAVERLLRDGLTQHRPDDAVLGEEFGATTGGGDRRWILDPIDGTAQFVVGDPNWRVQIALEDRGQITVAVVDSPALGVCWWATRGGGTFERTRADEAPRRLRVSDHGRVDGAHVACHPPAVAARVPDGVQWQEPRSPLPLVELIRGEIDAFYVECCQVWDHAPWVLLVQEAAGRFTDHQGGTAADRRGGLYSNAAVHDELFGAITHPRRVPPRPGPASAPPRAATAPPR